MTLAYKDESSRCLRAGCGCQLTALVRTRVHRAELLAVVRLLQWCPAGPFQARRRAGSHQAAGACWQTKFTSNSSVEHEASRGSVLGRDAFAAELQSQICWYPSTGPRGLFTWLPCHRTKTAVQSSGTARRPAGRKLTSRCCTGSCHANCEIWAPSIMSSTQTSVMIGSVMS